ncbi:MAG: hypothetical protein KC609_01910 [Myxococcales bacterium]|nr:hypothetical protein [Myxococcales bacterium]
MRRRWFTVWLVLGVFLVEGCSKNLDPKTPEGAFGLFVLALKQKDKGKVWDLSSRSVRQYFDDLYKKIKHKAMLIRNHYPDDIRDAELARIGYAWVKDAKNGKDLFLQLVSFKAIRSGTAVDIGLSHKPPEIVDGAATFRTAAGETFVFRKETDGVWRTDYLRVIQDSISKSNLLVNFEIVDKNIANIRSLANANFDSRKPAGAFNQLRRAFIKKDAGTIYNLCSEHCRQMFFQAYLNLMETANLLKKIKKGTLRDKLRSDYGVDVLKTVSGPKSLFVALWSFKKVKVGLEQQAGSRIKQVNINPAGTKAVVTTLSGQNFNFVKEKDGVWRTTDFEFPLQQTSLSQIKQNLDVLKNLIQRL